jgi:hypothetical protein
VGAADFYLASYPNSAEYKISVYALFMEEALRLTRLGGLQGYVVPDSFLLGKYFSRVRSYFLDESLISSIVLFREDFWESGTVGLPVVYIAQRQIQAEADHSHTVEVSVVGSVADFVAKVFTTDDIPQAFFSASPRRGFRLIVG